MRINSFFRRVVTKVFNIEPEVRYLPQPILVIAGTHQQAVMAAQALGIPKREFRYVSRASDIQGFHNVRILLTGTYWQNPVYSQSGLTSQVGAFTRIYDL